MANLLIEAERERIILCIDEGHRLYGSGESNNLANIMKPFLTRDLLQVIIATTLDEYNLFIAHDPAFRRRFEAVLHKEPNVDETFAILKHVIQKRHPDVTAADEALRELVSLGRRYIHGSEQSGQVACIARYNRCVGGEPLWKEGNNPRHGARGNIFPHRRPKASLCADMRNGLDGMETYLNEKFPGWEDVCRKMTESLSKVLTRGLRHTGPYPQRCCAGRIHVLCLTLRKPPLGS